MRFDFTFLAALLLSSTAANIIEPQHAVRIEDITQDNLFKRKGGGGGGGRGGGGGGGGSRGGSSGSSGSGGRSGSSSGGGSRGNTASSSNAGGTSRGGSGPPRSFGGNSYYGGGAAKPYRSGGVSPLGIAAVGLAAGALVFWPGHWLYGAYLYPYNHHYIFHNSTTNKEENLPVVCGCGTYEVCGCDENNTTMTELVGNGTYDALNKSLINVGDYNGQKTLLVNGTLPNGTTADGPDEGAGVGVGMKSLVEAAGLWSAAVCVIAAICLA
ncbi:hypothetical protein J3458_015621 [Metarhizium acridum]|uniref:Conserved glycine-rich protein n=1 Tax=Metarhizium acridum (strain CQMa 102) TaxID=655827 RepID=E9ECQ7_METAQ|nr:conserved glycine-rich protein [Metarhizium acridum CQMa 102]EFY86274.1 conserved glycine-rich protein [Metarhizium acridum CQMa 102]KAG8411562.1 hypothetical protein J3458_015621 [Metarhizium acridum]